MTPAAEVSGRLAASAAGLLLDAGFWIVLSLLAAGLIHEFLQTGRAQAALRGKGFSSVLAGVGLGAMLPICSCGVVPLSVGFYLGGARLAAVIAFTIATPVINPAAVLLSYALLGPELTLAYVAFGLGAPLLVGVVTERLGTREMPAAASALKSCCCSSNGGEAQPRAPSLRDRLARALRWGFIELGPMLGLYIGVGIVLASVLTELTPSNWIASSLGGAAPLTSLLLVALFGASIYVCAVAHIPLVAALLAAGAGPGAALVFLVTGAATNLPEMVALQRVLGTRTVAVYVGGVVLLSIGAGALVNAWLGDYRPLLDPLTSLEFSDLAQRMTPLVPHWLAVASALGVAALSVWGTWSWLARKAPRPTSLSTGHR